MFLPRMPYVFDKKRREAVSFGGINRTEQHRDGQMTNSLGVSSGLFPTLSQSKPFVPTAGYEKDITDVFEYDGKLAVISNSTLYYDGKAICNVQPGKKQFAVVNTKLCIFPDKIAVDIKEGAVVYMARNVVLDADKNGVELTGTALSATPVTNKAGEVEEDFRGTASSYAYWSVYTYGRDRAAVERCFEDGEWKGLEQYEELKDVAYNNTGRHIEVGDIIIPQVTEGDSLVFNMAARRYENGQTPEDAPPDKSLQNSEGYYGVITGYEVDLDSAAATVVRYDVYKTEGKGVLFSEYFEAGDTLTVEGTPFGLKDTDSARIESIDTVTNTLHFDTEAIRAVSYYYVLPNMLAADEELHLNAEGVYLKVSSRTALVAGTFLFAGELGGESAEVFVWDEQKKTATALQTEIGEAYTEGSGDMTEYSLSGAEIKVTRKVPDLDYICESDNRLWGVSNKDKTIYASELGVPHRFYTYGSLSTDSYAVAVGSEDEFTGICAYGGGVCCFKENRLHKILGSFPAEYYMNEYAMAGVQKNSERSIIIINEVLYFKGVRGVYAYSGGVPQLISYGLGGDIYTDACAAGDGRCYYIGMVHGGKGELFAYDIIHDVWMKEADIKADGLCSINGKVYVLTGGGLLEQSEDKSKAEWCAEFAPFDEMLWEKKGYSRLVLKLEMAKGSAVRIWVSEDKQPMKQIYNKAAITELSAVVPLRIGRCDRFTVKIEGKGEVILRGMLREFVSGKE